MKVVHMGDIGCMIDDLSKIKNCGVLMIPIGGYYTIDTKEALEYINQIQPRIVIPMHYRSGSMGYAFIIALTMIMISLALLFIVTKTKEN